MIDKFHPENILTDNNPFADAWGYWCFQEGVKAIFAHPYYPQDKGKVERAIRNISEELIYRAAYAYEQHTQHHLRHPVGYE